MLELFRYQAPRDIRFSKVAETTSQGDVKITWDIPIADAIMAAAELTAVVLALVAATRPSVRRLWRIVWYDHRKSFIIMLESKLTAHQVSALKSYIVRAHGETVVFVSGDRLTERKLRRIFPHPTARIVESSDTWVGGTLK